MFVLAMRYYELTFRDLTLLLSTFQLEGSNEVKLWNEIFVWTQQRVLKYIENLFN